MADRIHDEDWRDPTALIARGIEATAAEPDLILRGDIIRTMLASEYALATCITWWHREGEERHSDGGIHRCGGQVGHPGRHTCSTWNCRSWRNRT
jgi:hypothetical protein